MSILNTPQNWLGDTAGTISIGEQPIELRGRSQTVQRNLQHGLRPVDAVEISFEPQLQQSGERMCGAAALAMTLHALQVPCTQAELWSEIAYPDQQGELAARTFHLATAALHRGIPALVIQVRDPWQSLRHFVSSVPGLILNHRLKADSDQGHFTVLLDMNEESALIHDPLYGPSRLISRAKLEELWQPVQGALENAEVVGNILVGMGPRTQSLSPCSWCESPLAALAACSVCGNQFPLQPAALIGCMRGACPGCRWDQMFCPFCDAAFQPMG